MSNQAKGYEVCDPEIDDERWVRVDASGATEAVQMFLAAEDYDERNYDTGSPFHFLVRENEDDDAVKVSVRVIPMHFEIS